MAACTTARMTGLQAPRAIKALPFRPARVAPRPLSVAARAQSSQEQQEQLSSAALLAAAVTPFLLTPEAQAAGGEFGLLEGRTAALVHPAMMFFLFGASAYAGYLGLQWRRTRDLAGEIKALKEQLPAPDADGKRPASPLDSQIAALEQERKGLIQSRPQEKHFNWGSLLLGMGVAISIEGGINTWMRTGKLFPGPHLFAGVGITVLWAISAALVPAMQRGNDNARTAHIALNCVNLLLFASQIPTGLEIVGKVFEFTQWP